MMNATREKGIEMAYSKESQDPVTRSDCERGKLRSGSSLGVTGCLPIVARRKKNLCNGG